ncbi:MAG: choice-of-anchor J domain-containing protein [bacterium]
MKKFTVLVLSFALLLSWLAITSSAHNRVNGKKSNQVGTQSVVKGDMLNKVLGELTTESFEGETFPPAGWEKMTRFGGTGWTQVAQGFPVPGFGAGTVDVPPGGDNKVALVSWFTGDADGNTGTGQQTDQWLITPQITNIQPGDTLTFYLKYFDVFGDSLDVLISTTGRDSTTEFNILLDQIVFTSTSTNEWQKFSYDLTDSVATGSDIYIAFREHIGNTAQEGDALFLDLVQVSSVVTGIAESPSVPSGFALFQNYPNPFNPATRVSFTIAKAGRVSLKVYNALGQEVATMLDEVPLEPGFYTYEFNASRLTSGLYFYQLRSGSLSDTRKMILVK